MKFFAIRRRSDGAFLPTLVGRRGSTRVDPSLTLPPRLFRLASHARYALEWWVQGVWHVSRTGSQNYYGEYDYDEELLVEKVEGRNVADFDIVKAVIHIDRRSA